MQPHGLLVGLKKPGGLLAIVVSIQPRQGISWHLGKRSLLLCWGQGSFRVSNSHAPAVYLFFPSTSTHLALQEADLEKPEMLEIAPGGICESVQLHRSPASWFC